MPFDFVEPLAQFHVFSGGAFLRPEHDAGRAPFKDSVNALRSEGVRILLGPGEFEPHPPGSGGERITDFPWQLAIASVSDDLEQA